MRSAMAFAFGFLSHVGQPGPQRKTREAINAHRREALVRRRPKAGAVRRRPVFHDAWKEDGEQ